MSKIHFTRVKLEEDGKIYTGKIKIHLNYECCDNFGARFQRDSLHGYNYCPYCGEKIIKTEETIMTGEGKDG